MSDPSGPTTPSPAGDPAPQTWGAAPTYAPPPAPPPGPVGQPGIPQAVGPAPLGASILRQVSGPAAVGILLGLATVIVPLVWGYVFYVLPIAGFLSGIAAVRRGQLIGGVVAIVLNAMGAVLTLIGLTGG
jgi:hypothetical protein